MIPYSFNGPIAQMGERLICIQEVVGSIPTGSTIQDTALPQRGRAARGHSSAGRAPAWHAGGQGFEPPWLHHFNKTGFDHGATAPPDQQD